MHLILRYFFIVVLLATGCTSSDAVGDALFISASEGSDSNLGTRTAPLRSLDAAINRIKEINEASGTAKVKKVYLLEGIYNLDSTFLLSRERLGTHKEGLVISGYKNESIVISGGHKLKTSGFENVVDTSIVARLVPEAVNHIVQYDLGRDGLEAFGNFRSRPPHGTKERDEKRYIELFFNEKSLPVARWPNDDMVRIDSVIDRGSISKKDGYAAVLDTARVGGIFRYDFDRAQRWNHAKHIWLNGYFHWGWFHDLLPVQAIDHGEKQIRLAAPHMYGLRGSYEDGEWRNGEGFVDVRKFFVFNLLEEIDRPGEWFLDRDTRILYLWPPSDVSTADITVSLHDEPLVVLDTVSNITLKNITFAYGKSSGIEINGGTANVIKDCVLRNLGGLSIVASGSDHLITDTKITQIGEGGIVVTGGDRRSLTDGNITVANCDLSNYSIKSSTGDAIRLNGVGQKVLHNYIHHSDTRAIGLDGNNHRVAYNIIDSVHLKGDDVGAIGLGRNPSERGTIIEHNLFRNIGSPASNVTAIYLDDGTSGMTITGNVFYKASKGSYGCVFMNGGSDNHILNNIFIDSEIAANLSDCFHTWAAKRIVKWTDPIDGLWTERLTKEVDVKSEVWSKAYPNLVNFLENDPATPKGNVFDRNIMINTRTFLITATPEHHPLTADAFLTDNNYSTGRQEGWVKDGQLDFTNLNKDILDSVVGFEPIPFEEIGPHQ